MGPKLWGGHFPTKRHNICVVFHDLTSLEVISDQIFEKIWRKMRLAPWKRGHTGPKLLEGSFHHQNTWYMCYDPRSDLFGGHFWPNRCKISRKMRLASWKKGHMTPKLWGGLSPIKIHDFRSFLVGAIKTSNLNVVPRKSISFLPSSVDRKVVETVDMVQTVSLQLPVDGNSIPQVTSGPIWKISKNIFMVWPREPSYGCSKWFWEGDSYYCIFGLIRRR